jgi:flagellar basal-body rod protein FlgF
MDPLTITAAAGMRSRLESLDLLANNLSNTSAPGYKADRERFSLYLAQESVTAQEDGSGVAQPFTPVIQSHWTDTTQGELRSTGSSGDLALSGKGYFQVNGEDGPLFTRDGRFTVTKEGKLLTPSGYEFSSTGGKSIQVDPSLPVTVDPDGTVRQQSLEVGRLKMVDWPAEIVPQKRGGGTFQLDLESLQGLINSSAQVQQGYQEQSNLSPAEASVRLIETLRQFESLNKAAQIGEDMSRHSVEDVARVVG